jgi:hypothetical protein
MNAVNSLLFLRKHGKFKSWLSFWLLDVMLFPLVLFLGIFQGRARGVLAKGRGILEGILGVKSARSALARYLSDGEERR